MPRSNARSCCTTSTSAVMQSCGTRFSTRTYGSRMAPRSASIRSAIASGSWSQTAASWWSARAPSSMPDLRVALLTREYPPEVYGGAGVHVEYLARELAQLVDLTVHCFGADRPSPHGPRVVAHSPWEQLAGS